MRTVKIEMIKDAPVRAERGIVNLKIGQKYVVPFSEFTRLEKLGIAKEVIEPVSIPKKEVKENVKLKTNKTDEKSEN